MKNRNRPPAPKPPMPLDVKNSSTVVPFVISNVVCTEPQKQITFMKTHKTGSTSLQLILQMYGYYQNVSFLFNEKDPESGHLRNIVLDAKSQRFFLPPISIKKGDYENYKNYDISTMHMRYNRKVLDLFMSKKAKYITVVRNPVQQFHSAFVFFGYDDTTPGKTIELKMSKWLQNPKIHDKFLDNSQLFALGLDRSHFRDSVKVDEYIEKISREFDLVLVTEYFDESLLLLRKLMCWSYSDIVYLRQNTRFRKSSRSISDDVKDKIRSWNSADVRLYDFFNRTLWQKIQDYGPAFHTDLAHFRKLLQNVSDLCVENTALQKIGMSIFAKHNSRITYEPASNASDYCVLLVNRHKDVFHRLWKRQEKVGSGLLSNVFRNFKTLPLQLIYMFGF